MGGAHTSAPASRPPSSAVTSSSVAACKAQSRLSPSRGGSDDCFVAIIRCCEADVGWIVLLEPLVRHFSGVSESSGEAEMV